MKMEEIKDLSKDEIEAKIFGLKKELFQLRVEAKNQKLEQFHRMKVVKKNIARLMTQNTIAKKTTK